jgi:hypothetical protein
MGRRDSSGRSSTVCRKLLQASLAHALAAALEEWLHRLSHRSRSPVGKPLVGLLTYAPSSLDIELVQPSQANPSGNFARALRVYSCGAVADSHRASHSPRVTWLYLKEIGGSNLWIRRTRRRVLQCRDPGLYMKLQSLHVYTFALIWIARQVADPTLQD